MSSSDVKPITKENLDAHLYKLAKEIQKRYHPPVPVEIIIVGGASILVNYSFRESTIDIDAWTRSSSLVKEAANNVGDKYGLPTGWLNSDFVHTTSYSPKLAQHSKYYKTFCHSLEVRTVTAEYLIAMKLESYRPYKNDRSDIIGILAEQRGNGKPISLDKIKEAYSELYGSWEKLDMASRSFIEDHVYGEIESAIRAYDTIKNKEQMNKSLLQIFEKDYPGVLNENNLADVLSLLTQQEKDEVLPKESNTPVDFANANDEIVLGIDEMKAACEQSTANDGVSDIDDKKLDIPIIDDDLSL